MNFFAPIFVASPKFEEICSHSLSSGTRHPFRPGVHVHVVGGVAFKKKTQRCRACLRYPSKQDDAKTVEVMPPCKTAKDI